MVSIHPSPDAPAKKKPRHGLARHGVSDALLYVCYEGFPPSSLDGSVYNFADLSLIRRTQYDDHEVSETIVALKFQRHRLDRGPYERGGEYLRPSSRFDFSEVPWSAFYGPTISTQFRSIDAAKLTAAAKLLSRIEREPLPTHPKCDLERYVQLLERFRVPLAIKHVIRRGEPGIPLEEVLARNTPAGTAARYLDARASGTAA